MKRKISGKEIRFHIDRVAMNKICKIFVLFLLIAAGLFTGTVQTKAANDEGDRIEKEVKLNKVYLAEADIIALDVTVNRRDFDTMKIYRAVDDGGFKMLDTVSMVSGTWYYSENSWKRFGKNNKVICYAKQASFQGNMIIQDVTVGLGRKYTYKLVMKKEQGSVISNTITAEAKLGVPELLTCYSVNNNTSVRLKWSQVTKANGYQVYRYENGKWKFLKQTKKISAVSVVDDKVVKGKTYKYKIRAYAKVKGKILYSKYSPSRKVLLKDLTVKGDYKYGSVYGPYLNNSELAQVRSVVQSFKVNHIKKGMSDYDKALAAFNYIRSNCSYAIRGWQYNNANTAWGALVYGEAQCSGFARGMKALCDAAGVPCYYVHANAKAYNPSHQWNQIKIDGKWYIVDAQSGFFLIGSEIWKNDIRMDWDTKGLPICSKKNYKKGGFFGSII